MIISSVTETSLYLGIDYIQAKILVEVLRRTNQGTYKEAVEALQKHGFKDVSDSDVQATVNSSTFALGQFTDKLMTIKHAQIKDFEEGHIPEGSISKTVN